MQSHEVDYEIIGDDMQIVEVELDPGETVIAEAGAMNYMQDGITYEAHMGDGSKANEGALGKLLNVGKRVLTGESIFLTHFSNHLRESRSSLERFSKKHLLIFDPCARHCHFHTHAFSIGGFCYDERKPFPVHRS